jgi:hypothetical protein
MWVDAVVGASSALLYLPEKATLLLDEAALDRKLRALARYRRSLVLLTELPASAQGFARAQEVVTMKHRKACLAVSSPAEAAFA